MADNSTTQRVAIINQAMARHFFGNRPAMGRRFEFNKEGYEIIGVAKDVKYNDLRESTPPLVYFAVLQQKERRDQFAGGPDSGIYGTLAYAVAQRTNEIGIRMALGAQPASVLRMVLRDVLQMLAAGLAAGVLAALVCGRLVASMLFGLKPTDLATIVLAALALIVSALAAGYIPARRASRIDPLAALRFE